MRDAYRGFGFVDVLAARAGGTEGIDLQIGGAYLHVHLFGLGQHRHGDGGGLDLAVGFGDRDALHAVHAAFKLEAGVCALAVDHEADLLEPAEARFVRIHHFGLPAPGFCVHRIHAEQHPREQGALFSPGAGADLNDHVLIVVLIAREQQYFELVQILPCGLFAFGGFQREHFFQLRIAARFGEQLFGVRSVSGVGFVFSEFFHHRGEELLLFQKLCAGLHVRGGLGQA